MNTCCKETWIWIYKQMLLYEVKRKLLLAIENSDNWQVSFQNI